MKSNSFNTKQEEPNYDQIMEDIDWIYDDIIMLLDLRVDFELLETLDRVERLKDTFVLMKGKEYDIIHTINKN